MSKQRIIRSDKSVALENVKAFQAKAQVVFDTKVKASVEHAKTVSKPKNVFSCNNPV